MKFTKEIKDKWLTALKSGKYIQGRGKLKIKNEIGVSYCCLGVLAEESGIEINMCGITYDLQDRDFYNSVRENLGKDKTQDIIRANDNGIQDEYKDVIPLIEELEVVDS